MTQISYFGKGPNDEISGKNLLTYRPGITVLQYTKDPMRTNEFLPVKVPVPFCLQLVKVPK